MPGTPGIPNHSPQGSNSVRVRTIGREGSGMTCDTCGKKLPKRDASKLQRNKHHFCSRACYEVWWKQNVGCPGEQHPTAKAKHTVACLECGQKFRVAPYRKDTARFCSHACRGAYYFSGKRNPLWKGGVTEINAKVRQSPAYEAWRRAVYRRDRWLCQECGYKGRELIAHHPKRFADYPELRFDVSNGRTLCRACHARLENPQRLIRQTPQGGAKIESEPYGDIGKTAEMTVSLG
jgi:hypothetical protein